MNITDDYNFMENPFNILWNKEISYRFENILQSQEFMDQFDNFLSKNIGVSQNEIDNATKELTNILIAGALQADQAPKLEKLV